MSANLFPLSAEGRSRRKRFSPHFCANIFMFSPLFFEWACSCECFCVQQNALTQLKLSENILPHVFCPWSSVLGPGSFCPSILCFLSLPLTLSALDPSSLVPLLCVLWQVSVRFCCGSRIRLRILSVSVTVCVWEPLLDRSVCVCMCACQNPFKLASQNILHSMTFSLQDATSTINTNTLREWK